MSPNTDDAPREYGQLSAELADANNNHKENGEHRNSTTSSIRSLNPPCLSLKTKFFYSLGHVYNDLTVSIWFSYTLLYFQFQFPGALSGSLILIGQIADAVASPFVGYESDKSAHMWLCTKLGRRKTWHLLGVIMNTVSVPLVYNQCFGCEQSPEWAQFFYYSILIVIFQAGWAATQVNQSKWMPRHLTKLCSGQVSHVSLITDLTSNTNERIELNSYRQVNCYLGLLIRNRDRALSLSVHSLANG